MWSRVVGAWVDIGRLHSLHAEKPLRQLIQCGQRQANRGGRAHREGRRGDRCQPAFG